MSRITVMSMSGVYDEDEYFKKLLNSCGMPEDINIIDCTDIRGTEMYCDDFACTDINERMDLHGVTEEGIHFIDNGNYHYLSYMFTRRIKYPYELLVIDNHPDMKEPVFGPILSCGGWVKNTLEADENLKMVYLCGVKNELITDDIIGDERVTVLGRVNDSDFGTDRLCRESELPLYISVDRDVLSKKHCMTNWDQGIMTTDQLAGILKNISESRNIIGMDICGGMDIRMLSESSDEDMSMNASVDRALLEVMSSL